MMMEGFLKAKSFVFHLFSRCVTSESMKLYLSGRREEKEKKMFSLFTSPPQCKRQNRRLPSSFLLFFLVALPFAVDSLILTIHLIPSSSGQEEPETNENSDTSSLSPFSSSSTSSFLPAVYSPPSSLSFPAGLSSSSLFSSCFSQLSHPSELHDGDDKNQTSFSSAFHRQTPHDERKEDRCDRKQKKPDPRKTSSCLSPQVTKLKDSERERKLSRTSGGSRSGSETVASSSHTYEITGMDTKDLPRKDGLFQKEEGRDDGQHTRPIDGEKYKQQFPKKDSLKRDSLERDPFRAMKNGEWNGLSDIKVSEKELGQAQRSLLERTMLCSDLDESPEMCESHPRCTYRWRISSAAGGRGEKHEDDETKRKKKYDDSGEESHLTPQEKRKISSPGVCVLDGEFLKQQVQDGCMMIPKGTILAIARDLHREGLMPMGSSVISHLRTRGDPTLLCRAITHSYFSNPDVQLHHLLSNEEKENELSSDLFSSTRYKSSEEGRVNSAHPSVKGERSVGRDRKDHKEDDNERERRKKEQEAPASPFFAENAKKFIFSTGSKTGEGETHGGQRKKQNTREEKKEASVSSARQPSEQETGREGERGGREEEEEKVMMMMMERLFKKQLKKLSEKPWKRLHPWEKLIRILH
ncbi:hypothetical protein CSUI_005219 [Cystoisospora suis]|uniref:Transmembrane protein n=1 Tax=Cystoisospora suis TaxID=483139 RepID=A0A2C6KVZ2_9APIC|nr:hypothetical protein CSUI_005219 [Cystoisospora suis]